MINIPTQFPIPKMPTNFFVTNKELDNSGILGEIRIPSNSKDIYAWIDNEWSQLAFPEDNVLLTVPMRPRYFNCKHCGAPAQINYCSYCGCAED